MTKLLIAYPQNARALLVDAPDPDGNDFSVYNLLGGSRLAQYKTAEAASLTVEYTFAAAVNIDTVFIGDAADIVSSNWSDDASTFTLELDYWDGDSWENIKTDSDIDSFVGMKGKDYVLHEPNSETSTLWRVVITPDQDSEFKISKLFLCKALDLGREPSSISHRFDKEPDDFTSLDGHFLPINNLNLFHIVDLEWTMIRDANKAAFLAAMQANEKRFILLFNTDANMQLADHRCIYGFISDLEFSPTSRARNTISMVLNEQF